jgi:hypothetical protein
VAPVFCTTAPGAVVGVCAAIEGSTAESVPVLGVAEAPVPEGFRFPVGRLVPLDPLDDPLLPLDPLLEPLEPLELDEVDLVFATVKVDGTTALVFPSPDAANTWAEISIVPPLVILLETVTVKLTSSPLVSVEPTLQFPADMTQLALILAFALAPSVSLGSLTFPEMVDTCARYLTADPAWKVPLLRRLSETSSAGVGGGDVLGDEGGVETGDLVGPGVVFGVFVGVGAAESAEGDGVAPSARATGAAPLTRTSPVPTQMISGFRTDRASTAHDLLNNRL